jgi:hypothetical protein
MNSVERSKPVWLQTCGTVEDAMAEAHELDP